MLIHDIAAATTRALTPEGFLRVRARIGRTGMHLYKACELGDAANGDPNAAVRVYRPPEAVFDPDSMNSFAGKPVTDDHPPAMVDAGNWKRYAVGQSGPAVTREGDHLATDLLITDAEAVRRAEAGAQLSNGYHADFDFTPGVTPDGEPYDAVQSNIRGNHIALVDAGRCGASCRVGDAAGSDCACGQAASAPLVVTIDGIAVETTPAGAEALGRLKRSLEAKDGTIAALQAEVLDDATLDLRAAERARVVDAARGAFGQTFDIGGRSTAAIRRAVVERCLDKALDGCSDAYVAAAFDTLQTIRATGGNVLATHFAATVHDGRGDREAARKGRDRFLTQAWKGEPTHGVF